MRKENNYKIFTSRYDLEYLNELIDLFQSMVLIKPIEEENGKKIKPNFIEIAENKILWQDLKNSQVYKTSGIISWLETKENKGLNQEIKKRCEKLTKTLPGPEQIRGCGGKFAKTVLEGEKETTYDYCIRLDFCGLSASTLLNTHNLNNKEVNLATRKIYYLFKLLISKDNCDILKNNSIYLKIRFLFEYLYSEMSFSLMKAENAEIRPMPDDPDSIVLHCYNFKEEPGLNTDDLKDTNIYKIHNDSIKEVLKIFKNKKEFEHLKPDLSHKAVHTFQLRFTPIPIPFCMLMINNIAYNDAYGYAMQKNDTRLSFTYPLIKINLNDAVQPKSDNNAENSLLKNQLEDFESHFDYLWHHQLTIVIKDTYVEDAAHGLRVKFPYEINFSEKRLITEAIQTEKNPNNPTSIEKQKLWLRTVKTRFQSSTKLPYNFSTVISKSLCIMFTDFAGFTALSKSVQPDQLLTELEEIFRKFDEISKEFGLLKIKTIGDAYMAVCGTEYFGKFYHNSNDILNCLKAGIRMQEEIERRKKNQELYFEGMRIGLHYGDSLLNYTPQGVDVWGPTVNLAQRMEPMCELNSICMTKASFDILNDSDFNFKSLMEPPKHKKKDVPHKKNDTLNNKSNDFEKKDGFRYDKHGVEYEVYIPKNDIISEEFKKTIFGIEELKQQPKTDI